MTEPREPFTLIHSPSFDDVLDVAEDDARPDGRERIEGAWLRLFGTPLADEREVDSFDGGDTTWTLYASGRIAISSYCCEAISVARVVAVLVREVSAEVGE